MPPALPSSRRTPWSPTGSLSWPHTNEGHGAAIVGVAIYHGKAERAGAAVGQVATLHRYIPQPATSPAGPYRAVEVGFDIPDRRGT
jgi:hypothetical protein